MTAPWIVGFVALWGVTLLTATIVLGLLRRVSTVLEAAERRLADSTVGPGAGGAAPGTRIEHFEARLDGASVSSDELFPGVFVFMSTGCEPCRGLAKSLAKVGERVGRIPVYVVFEDTPAVRDFPIPPNVRVLYQQRRVVSDAFDTIATPQAFAVSEEATIVERRIPGSADDIRELARLCDESNRPASEQVGFSRR
jgi:thiol-disulfide isomerase/thioredoxin